MWIDVKVDAMTGKEMPKEICPEGEHMCKIVDISDVQLSHVRGTPYVKVKLCTIATKVVPEYTLYTSLVGSMTTLQLLVKVRKALINTKCRCFIRHENRFERTFAIAYLRP